MNPAPAEGTAKSAAASTAGHASLSGGTAGAQTNGLGRTFGLLGDEWTLLLLRVALSGGTRYSDFQSRLPISHAVLSGRLERLVEEGLLERHVYQQRPERSEYLLTPRGTAIWPLLVAIWNWERRWVRAHEYSTPPIRHLSCGQEMSPLYCCEHCGEIAHPDSVRLSWGPAGGWQRSTPEATTRRRSTHRSNAGATAFYPDTMAVFGNRWSAIIAASAFAGVSRFKDFEAHLGVPPIVLTERLAALCDRQIFEQVQLEARPDWSEYLLTSKGRELFPIFAIVLDLAERWYRDPEGEVLLRRHSSCGARFHGMLVCDQCHEVVRGNAIDVSEI